MPLPQWLLLIGTGKGTVAPGTIIGDHPRIAATAMLGVIFVVLMLVIPREGNRS